MRMGMILGKMDLDQLLVIKNEFARDVENFLDQAIGAETCQGGMGQSGGAEHTEEIVRQIIQQDEGLLGVPEALATMGQKQALLVIANVNFSRPAQVIEMAELLGRRVQIRDDEESMLEFVLAHIQPTQGECSGRPTEM